MTDLRTELGKIHFINPLAGKSAKETGYGYFNDDPDCVECGEGWPCRTIRLLDAYPEVPVPTKPSAVALARATLRATNSAEFTELAECQGYPAWMQALEESEAILRRLHGRTEAEIKAEALHDLAAHMETLPAGARTIHDPATIRAYADRDHPRKDHGMTDYTPTTRHVRLDFAHPWEGFNEDRNDRLAGFDRWLNSERARIWDEGFSTDIYAPDYRGNPYRSTP